MSELFDGGRDEISRCRREGTFLVVALDLRPVYDGATVRRGQLGRHERDRFSASRGGRERAQGLACSHRVVAGRTYAAALVRRGGAFADGGRSRALDIDARICACVK
jgi:hypothetical protein